MALIHVIPYINLTVRRTLFKLNPITEPKEIYTFLISGTVGKYHDPNSLRKKEKIQFVNFQQLDCTLYLSAITKWIAVVISVILV